MSYRKKLNIRKLNLRVNGWHEMNNLHRCGHHWVHESYPNEKFSIHEAEYINKIGDNENEEIMVEKYRGGILRQQSQAKRVLD